MVDREHRPFSLLSQKLSRRCFLELFGQKMMEPSAKSPETSEGAKNKKKGNAGMKKGNAQQMADIASTLQNHSDAIQRLDNIPTALAELRTLIQGQNTEKQPQVDPPVTDDDANDVISELLSKSFANENKTDETLTEYMEILNENQPLPEYGPELQKDIAESFNRLTGQKISKEKYEKWKDSIKAPANCKTLGVPRVNPEIWNVLPSKTRQVDFDYQQMQQSISMASITVAKLAEKIFLSNREIPNQFGQELLRMTMETANILSSTNQDINAKRKQEIRPALNEEVQSVCSSSTPVTEFLFGDNVCEQLKASKSAATIIKPASAVRGARFTPYNTGRGGNTHLNFQRASTFQAGGPKFRQYPRGQYNRRFSRLPQTRTQSHHHQQ